MNARRIFDRWSAGMVTLFLAAAAVAAQPAPRDYTLHNSPLLAMASPGSPIQVER